ncbi:ComEC/Rec2 family competence protein [Acetobacter sp. A11-2]|uniref:ComEC/Rec2 family competence protein n=1 Tax=Acetobacter sp. A11-2 TaxID=3157859 RepID=UPI0032EDD500
MPRLMLHLHSLLVQEQRRLVLWAPVGLALGAVLYFGLLRTEPSLLEGFVLPCGVAVLASIAAWRMRYSLWGRLLWGGCITVALGFAAAWGGTHRHTPMPDLPRFATEISGTVQAIALLPPADGTDAPFERRVDLAQAVFYNALNDGMPPLRRVLSVYLQPTDSVALQVGDHLRVKALLQPPPFPALPGARDRQFEAWFANQAGSGRALGHVQLVATVQTGQSHKLQLWFESLRERMNVRIHAVLPGPEGGVAATVLVGASETVEKQVREDFAASGLAHLLAVAGLHLGIVMGLVMAAARLLLATTEYTALRWPCKALAALCAWGVGLVYVLLTGAHLPAQRSLLMAAVAVLGIAAGRRVVSMRGLAVAACVLALCMPQVVMGVAFQMSMAAVMALVAGYEVLQPKLTRWRASTTGFGHWLAWHGAVLALTSVLAGCATLPVAMAHFGVIQPFFVVANMVAVPLMAVWIMPFGLLAVGLMPLHMDAPFLWLMGAGIRPVIWLAHMVAHWPAARVAVPHMPGWGLLAVMLGLCWICLWRQHWRWGGCAGLVLGMASPWLVVQPDVVISPDGGLVGVRDSGKVYVIGQSRAVWPIMQAWGQYFAQPVEMFPPEGETPDGALTCGAEDTPDTCVALLRGQDVVVRRQDASDGREPLPAGICTGADVVISTAPLRASCLNVPIRLDRFSAWENGAEEVFLHKSGNVVRTDRAWRGQRPWVLKPGGHGMPVLPLAPAE